MVNLNKILPWLSIRNKLLIAFGGLSILPMLFVGIYGTLSNVQTLKSAALEELTTDVQTIREKTANFLEDISSDLKVLRNSSSLENWTREPITAETARSNALKQMEKELLALAKTKSIYYQVRLIDHNGDELLRVECAHPGDSVKSYRIAGSNELRHGRESYYFLLVNSVGADNIAFSPAEIIHGGDERIPVMSFAMRISGAHGLAGIMVANVFEKEFIRVIESKRQFDPNRKVILTTGDGHYLYHSEKKTDWNRLLASREEDNLHRDYSPDVADAVLSGNQGTLTEGSDEIISYAPLFSGGNAQDNTKEVSKFSVPVFIMESVPEDAIMGHARSFAFIFICFMMLFLAGAIGLGLLATRQFTQPIAQLEAGAEIIARGNYAHRLDVKTHDEIEKLADQFNVMASSLEAHEGELQRHRSTLEEMVGQRTRELLGEKTKLQALLDNVPSAFVVLDKDFRIQTASAAFEGVTGFSFADVKDRDCGNLFERGETCSDCLCRRATETGTIESRIEQVFDRNRGERFVERIAIPMKEHGEVSSILQIITDVTKRKRLEQELVHTEKLTAAGEMSSIIAHEFRNSLTSIKMIVQLMRESKRISRTEKKSLEVALDSMHHMEGIVVELLDFARPKPVQLTEGNLSAIVNESLEFIKPHTKEKHIEVIKNLELAPDPMKLDGSRIKEAIINVLLNAIQALPPSPIVGQQRTIAVASKGVRLQQTLRELAFHKEAGSDWEGSSGPEIVLAKGTHCALVEISDTGCGIAQDQIQRIFDPFFTTKINGTGLGLPMVKRTVNAHGGVVTVESEKDRGTTFRIYLPLTYEA